MDLPQPDGPDEGDELPGLDVEVDALEGDELAQPLVLVAADPEGLADALSSIVNSSVRLTSRRG